MASITSLSGSSSNVSSIYGNSNIISGLASGMDTESMIENAVSGIQNKIASLQQKATKITWEQEAYRDIIDKLANFANKYTSYSSSTNLLSQSFFNNSIKVTTSGVNKDLVTASGKASSNVQLLGVKQLASAATYSVSGIAGSASSGKIVGDQFTEKMTTGTLDGSLELMFGSTSAKINFSSDKLYTSVDDMVSDINEQLQNTELKDKVSVKAVGSSFEFEVASNWDSNSLKIKSASDSVKEVLNLSTGDENVAGKSFKVENLTEEKNRMDVLKDSTVKFTLDGVTKEISFAGYEDFVKASENKKPDGSEPGIEDYLNSELEKAFGADKITVNKDTGFSFTPADGSTLSISGGKVLGLKSDDESSYVNLNSKLSDLFGVDEEGNLNGLTPVEESESEHAGKYELKINGKAVGYFDKDTTLESVIYAINNNADSEVSVSFSKITNEFQFTSKETGAASKIEFGDGLASKLFSGGTGEVGKDAIFSMSVNGTVYDGISRSSNSFDVDGMTIKLGGTFGEYGNDKKLDDVDAAKANAVSFTASSDSDKIVEAVKSMVKDFNEMANAVKDAYSTQPLYNSKGKRYEPLTEQDEEDMSDSAIEKHNEKAKTGILFGDNTLSSLYSELRTAISDLGLSEIGITTEYSNGKTTLVLDETKLRDTLETNPQKVTDVFTRSTADGASTDGVMQSQKKTLDTYAKTTGTKGILIDLAGSVKAPASINNNTYYQKLASVEEQISRWQDKLSDKIDYYTRQFTQLEKLISQMNSQSSSLMGMMGY